MTNNKVLENLKQAVEAQKKVQAAAKGLKAELKRTESETSS